MLNVKAIIVSNKSLRERCTNERKVRQWDKKLRRDVILDDSRRWRERDSSDVRWKTVPQTSGCNMKRSIADSGQTSTSNVQRRWWGRTYIRRHQSILFYSDIAQNFTVEGVEVKELQSINILKHIKRIIVRIECQRAQINATK